jgi:DNA-binding sugar fermentation-stimulating protein
MKANIKIIKEWEKVVYSIVTVIIMKGNGKIIKYKDKVYIITNSQIHFIQVNGKIVNKMVREFLSMKKIIIT